MKKKYFSVFVFFLFISTMSFSQKIKQYSSYEKKCIGIFKTFMNEIKDGIKMKTDMGDSVKATYIWNTYLFTESHIDSPAKLNSSEKELNDFYHFFQERENKKLAENITAIPVRLSVDKSIYNKLTAFQKSNTFIFYDKRYPEKILGYMLFMPPIKDKIPKPRIWSWTLIFKFGKFMFKSVTGEEGYEYIFSPEEFKK